MREHFGLRCCRETIRAALHRLKLSWKKAKKLLGRADPERRQAFIEQLRDGLAGAQRDQHWWSFWTRRTSTRTRISVMAGPSAASASGLLPPRRACRPASRSMGFISTTRARCGCGPSRAPTASTPSRFFDGCGPNGPIAELLVLWDGAPYHRAQAVREVARTLDIKLMPLPGYSPDLMPVEALWHWLREDVTYHHCHASADDLTRRVADFEARLNREPFVIADRLWVKDTLDPDEEKLRFSK